MKEILLAYRESISFKLDFKNFLHFLKIVESETKFYLICLFKDLQFHELVWDTLSFSQNVLFVSFFPKSCVDKIKGLDNNHNNILRHFIWPHIIYKMILPLKRKSFVHATKIIYSYHIIKDFIILNTISLQVTEQTISTDWFNKISFKAGYQRYILHCS